MTKPRSSSQSYTRRMDGYLAEEKVRPAKHEWQPLVVKPHQRQADMDAYRALPSLWR